MHKMDTKELVERLVALKDGFDTAIATIERLREGEARLSLLLNETALQRDAAESEAATLRARVERLEEALARHREDREYVIGWNDGFDLALTKIVALQFPTTLRKMWSGGEVQAWLDASIRDARAALTKKQP